MASTTVPESHLDLTEAQVATLATIDPQGRPQLSAVWFLYEDGVFRVSMNDTRKKARNLADNPAINLFVLNADGSRYLEVRGDAELTDDSDYEVADRIGSKYGADLRTFDAPGTSRVAVAIVPQRVNAVDINAG